MKVIDVSGSPRSMGQQQGEAERERIQAFYRLRVNNALMQAKSYGGKDRSEAELLRVANASLPFLERFSPQGLEEQRGIAEGADLSLLQVVAMNGLTDYRDVLAWGEVPDGEGCSSFVIGERVGDGGILCGQTWDLATDNLPYVIGIHRCPESGPETWSMTTVGCLTLIGMNAEGVSVGTTNLRTTNARPGVHYLSILHEALASDTARLAVSALQRAERAGAHFFFLCDKTDALAVETTPAHVDIVEVTTTHVHCNHCLVPAHAALEGSQPSTSSHYRQPRLQSLIDSSSTARKPTAADARIWLSDTSGGENAICRDDTNGINTNGAVVMRPSDGTIHAVHGLPSTGSWVDLKTGAPV